ncbi:peptidylprolyl isomerase [Sulfurimonas autotrophica]|uniref:peptidylprolyl isomerase n=1 Tax=Sulfurimonas autotrophica (strain ATCC BAA-671 / DSM 16294 / JCM 11897 / OK10) TaxID=563040 RepID=E0UPJ1_SULAO|nr:peptidyl-prolyl cis-trans isomerase [Sulfurimonas autotrophica]ADN09721.1 PpiC-type peptidyl-prolyl cis-trans isomerase [Sulfurimonas autotrophica DSM 16294]
MNKVTMLLSALLLTGSIASAKTLVTVNGKAITQQDVDTELMNATQGRFNQVPADRQAAFRQQVLQQLIGKELIYNDAKKSGIINSKEYKSEYKKLEQRMKKELAIQVWQKKLLDSIKISNKELKDYYNKNKEEFNEKESVHARHILVKAEDEAKKIIAQLKSLSGEKLKEKFIELAKKESTGPSGPKGGDLGYFSKGQMVPAFNDKVFSMKKGEVTLKPVKTQFGYHVIYVEDKKPSMTRSFDEVKAFIEQRLKMEKFKAVMKKKMDALQKKAAIK